MKRSPERSISKGSSPARTISGVSRSPARAPSRSPSDETTRPRLPQLLHHIGDLAPREAPDLHGHRLVDHVSGHQDPDELRSGQHRHRHRGRERVPVLPERGRLLALERREDQRLLRKIVAGVTGVVGACHEDAVPVGGEHEVCVQVQPALLERIQRRRLVELRERRLEIGIVGQNAQPQAQLVEPVGLDGFPHAAGSPAGPPGSCPGRGGRPAPW